MAARTANNRRESLFQLYDKLQQHRDDDALSWLQEGAAVFDDKHDHPHQSGSPFSSYSYAPSAISLSPPKDDSDSDSDSNADGYSHPDQYTLGTDHDFDGSKAELLEPIDLFEVENSFDSQYEPDFDLNQSVLTSRPSDPSPMNVANVNYRFNFVPEMVPPEERYSSRSSRPSQKIPLQYDESDADADGESTGDATDDEYLPSPLIISRKRRAPSDFYAPSSPASTSHSTSFTSSPSPSMVRLKRPRTNPAPRNTQASSFSAAHPPLKPNPWACPHCPWIQRNRRTPDLKRHIRTHFHNIEEPKWVCCGVPLELATQYGVPTAAVHVNYRGRVMVGGCFTPFSRRDALKRHLGNTKIPCVGNIGANWFGDEQS
ncbi:hypothetical protein JAAARDRAFT_30430 [Jaapia argillacea MUCL 33604]|uniref:C2H2-type domain-containing protein n=1 Tax=Jaapia argillacea MUCL 33604 TaxID=933084 RepID=A0A067Q8P4_9AGAM|nr:hypothetical protein JAAARDRAFT_30430 [Jaapia argillacea MUCL 33604]